jgi:hypothetical protein
VTHACNLIIFFFERKALFFHLPKTFPNLRDLTALNSVPEDKVTPLFALWLTYKLSLASQISERGENLMIRKSQEKNDESK